MKFVDDFMTNHKSSLENIEKAVPVVAEVVKSARELVFDKAPSALEKSHVDKGILAEDFVDRPDVKAKIQEA